MRYRIEQRGFTLVELLVVMTIISILAGLLLPTLAKAVRAARRIACTDQVRQQYLALVFYQDDYSENLPYRTATHVHYVNSLRGGSAWRNYMPDCTKASIWVCPEYTCHGHKPGSSHISWEKAARWGGGYSLHVPVKDDNISTGWRLNQLRDNDFYQNKLPNSTGDWWKRDGNRLHLIKRPSKTILINENYRTDDYHVKECWGGDPRHLENNGGGVLVFVDGHAEWSWKMTQWPYGPIWWSDL